MTKFFIQSREGTRVVGDAWLATWSDSGALAA